MMLCRLLSIYQRAAAPYTRQHNKPWTQLREARSTTIPVASLVRLWFRRESSRMSVLLFFSDEMALNLQIAQVRAGGYSICRQGDGAPWQRVWQVFRL